MFEDNFFYYIQHVFSSIYLLSTNDSQNIPKYPLVQIQVNSPGSNSGRHCPLFWHGFDKHGFSARILQVRPIIN